MESVQHRAKTGYSPESWAGLMSLGFCVKKVTVKAKKKKVLSFLNINVIQFHLYADEAWAT